MGKTTIGAAFAVFLLLRVIPVLVKRDGNPYHELHWIVYGYDRVWYQLIPDLLLHAANPTPIL